MVLLNANMKTKLGMPLCVMKKLHNFIVLMHSLLGKNFREQDFETFFLFSQKIGFNSSCKLSPWDGRQFA